MILRQAARAGIEDLLARLDAAGRPWSRRLSLWLDHLTLLAEASSS